MKKPQDYQYKDLLLQLARDAIVNSLLSKLPPQPPGNLPPELIHKAAVFVTLTEKGRLMGCIGSTSADMLLVDAVITMARAAAFEDPRFPPLTLAEMPNIKIEISVLSDTRKVPNADEISPFLHGVIVRRGSKSGLFLPQVWEVIPDKERFLAELCASKAGLPPHAWKESDAELYVFTVESFRE